MGNDYCDGCGQDISKNGYCKCTLANIKTIGRHSNPDDCDSCEVLQKANAELRAKLKISEEMLRFFERERCKFDEMAEERGARDFIHTLHSSGRCNLTDVELVQLWREGRE